MAATLTLGEQIALFRKRQKVSQTQLAEVAGLSRAMISLLERDATNPTIGSLESVAMALGLKVVIDFVPADKPKSRSPAPRTAKNAASGE